MGVKQRGVAGEGIGKGQKKRGVTKVGEDEERKRRMRKEKGE